MRRVLFETPVGVCLLLVLGIGLVVGLVWPWSVYMVEKDRTEFQQVCRQLNGNFIEEPKRLCIRDGEIVYR